MNTCTFQLELVSRLAPGETWRFLRAAQAAVEDDGGIWEGEAGSGIALLDPDIVAEWRQDGSRLFTVSVSHPETWSCGEIERFVRERASAWLEPVTRTAAARTQDLDTTVVVSPMGRDDSSSWIYVAAGLVAGALIAGAAVELYKRVRVNRGTR